MAMVDKEGAGSGAGLDMFGQAIEAFSGSLKASARLQETITRWWTAAPLESVQTWQKRSQEIFSEAVPAAVRRSADCYLQAFDQSYRTGIELLKMAVDAGPALSLPDAQVKTQKLLAESFSALRTNAQEINEANLGALKSWNDVLVTQAGELKSAVKASTRVAQDAVEVVSRPTSKTAEVVTPVAIAPVAPAAAAVAAPAPAPKTKSAARAARSSGSAAKQATSSVANVAKETAPSPAPHAEKTPEGKTKRERHS